MKNDEIYEDELDRMRSRKNRPVRKKTDEDFLDVIIDEEEKPVRGRPSKAASSPGKRAAAKKRKKKKNFFRIALVLVVLFCGYLIFQRVRDNGYWTIAVFGVDSRDGKVGKGALSDVEMICTINKKTGEIRLMSVFRDSYLDIGDGQYDKINEAYFLGGHKQAVAALEKNLDIRIDDYATFNWKAVADAINVLGGVDIEITDREFAYINSFITETVQSTGIGSVQLTQSGMNHLDGVQAVAYARLRLMDTDFNRTERQRKVLGQAMEKAKSADFETLRVLVGTVFPQISTSIGVDDLITHARKASDYYIGQTSGFPFSHTEMKIGKKDCVIPTTLESNVTQLHEFLYNKTNYRPSSQVKSISDHIAEVSGLKDPGKDTESGRNTGTGGQTGNEGKQPAKETPQQTVPAEETTTEETTEESVSEESTEQESESNQETIPTMPEETKQPESKPSETDSGPGVDSGKPKETPPETSASLEGPGQGNSDSQPEEVGPGVS